MSTRDNMHRTVRAHVESGMSDDLLRLIHQAQYDLHCGPGGITGDGYPGFVTACRRIAAEIDIHDLWISEDLEISDSEPEWADPSADEPGEWPDMWSRLPSGTVRDIVLGELQPYVGHV